MKPLVSILVPVYGVERYAEQFACSLFRQSYENLEIIIVDDVSPDRSMEIIRAVAERYPGRTNQIRYVRNEKNLKQSGTRNKALALATGKYILQIDSDDWMEPDLVEKMTATAEKSDADIVWCDYFQNCGKRETIHRQPCTENPEICTRKILLSELHPAYWNKLVRRELYAEHDIECIPEINFSEDMVCTARLFAVAEKVVYLPEPLYHYRYTPNSITKWLARKDYEDQFILHSVLRSDLPDGMYEKEIRLREICILAEIAIRYPDAASLEKLTEYSVREISLAPLHASKRKLLSHRKNDSNIRFHLLRFILKNMIYFRAWMRRIKA